MNIKDNYKKMRIDIKRIYRHFSFNIFSIKYYTSNIYQY